MSPARAVLGLGALFGLLFLLATPPFQAPDERNHFLRAYQVSEGHLFAPGGPAGAILPASLGTLADRFAHLPGHPELRIPPGSLRDALALPLEPERRTSYWIGAVVVYTPVPYLPQALGILPGRLLGLPPLVLLYLARLGNLTVALGVAWSAIRLAPGWRWPLALTALLPMAVFLRASASADALTDAASLLVVAAVLALAFGADDKRQASRATTALFAASAVLVLAKAIYAPLPLAVLAVPAARLGGRRRAAIVLGGLLLVTALAFAGAAATARQGYLPMRPGLEVSPAAQAAEIARHPLRAIGILGRDTVRHAPNYAAQVIGKLGWLDTPLPAPLVAAYALLLLGAGLAGGGPLPLALSAAQRLVIGAVLAATLALVSLSQYLTWTPVGAPYVEGIQGRYFLPVLPLGLLLLTRRGWARDWTGPRASYALFAAAALGLAGALAALVIRFYDL